MLPENRKASKFLSLLLRHRPEVIGLTLDENGWANVDELIEKLDNHGSPLTFSEIKEIVETNDKKRFILSDDNLRIRANQGHSIAVDLQLKEIEPPEFLYHGTAEKNIESIREKGLIKGERQHVHLSLDIQTAKSVGSRYGKPVVLKISSGQMYKDNYAFFKSENGVWLTDTVPEIYINGFDTP